MVNGKRPIARTTPTTTYSGVYPEFMGFRFKVLSNPEPDQSGQLNLMVPTYLNLLQGQDLKVSAHAPTIIASSSGHLTLHGYAPVLIRGNTGGIDATVDDNLIIEESTGPITIVAGRNIEFVADMARYVNGEDTYWKPHRISAPEGSLGYVFFKGRTDSICFSHAPKKDPLKPYDRRSETLTQRVLELLR